jgi:hypothetical protein
VRLRHLHHYDPLHWPVLLWLCFLAPLPFAILMWGQNWHSRAWRIVGRICVLISALLVFAFVFAGIWYISERLVQLSLWRFSIYVKLFSCIAFAIWIEHRILRSAPSYRKPWSLWAQTGCAIALVVIFWSHLGIRLRDGESADYLEVCRWSRDHTPVDATFLVPPSEESFRLHGQRAIVINFKGAGQLRNEIAQWQERLSDVVGVTDLRTLPHSFVAAQDEISRRYDQRPLNELFDVARKYRAEYVVLTGRSDSPDAQLLFSSVNSRFFLYHLIR